MSKYEVTRYKYNAAGEPTHNESVSVSSAREAARLAAKGARAGFRTAVYTSGERRSSRSKSIRFPVMRCGPERHFRDKKRKGQGPCKVTAKLKRLLKAEGKSR